MSQNFEPCSRSGIASPEGTVSCRVSKLTSFILRMCRYDQVGNTASNLATYSSVIALAGEV